MYFITCKQWNSYTNGKCVFKDIILRFLLVLRWIDEAATRQNNKIYVATRSLVFSKNKFCFFTLTHIHLFNINNKRFKHSTYQGIELVDQLLSSIYTILVMVLVSHILVWLENKITYWCFWDAKRCHRKKRALHHLSVTDFELLW